MSLVAAELERRGIPTVVISLLRMVAERLRPPRALFVPFRHGFPLGRPHAALWQGLASWVRGRPASAFRHWHRAIAFAERYGTHYECARAHLEIGRHLDARDLDRRQHLRRAEELFLSLGCPTDASRARVLMAASAPEA